MIRAVLVLSLLSVISLVSCGSDSEPLNESRAKVSENGEFFIRYEPIPDPIPFNELFELTVEVAEPGARDEVIADATVDVRADMPVHAHGMPTEPAVTQREDGTFLIEGMKFHMRSTSEVEHWNIYVDVESGGRSDTATFKVMCCGE